MDVFDRFGNMFNHSLADFFGVLFGTFYRRFNCRRQLFRFFADIFLNRFKRLRNGSFSVLYGFGGGFLNTGFFLSGRFLFFLAAEEAEH